MRLKSAVRTWGEWRRAYAASVSSAIRGRGREYFDEAAVDLSHVEARRVEATVTGSQLYAVELEIRSGDLQARCTCPYFDQYFEVCKHIWATLLAAEDDERIRGGGEEAFGEEEKSEQDLAGSARGRPGPRRLPGWKEHVARIRQGLLGDAGEPWPPEREIGYVVDMPATFEGGGLIVEIAQRQRKSGGEWSRLKAQKIPMQRTAGLPLPDRQAIAVLLGGRHEASWSAYAYAGPYGLTATYRRGSRSPGRSPASLCLCCVRPEGALSAPPARKSPPRSPGARARPGSSGWSAGSAGATTSSKAFCAAARRRGPSRHRRS